MISVEMEDVLAVLQLCKPYIIGIIAALVIGIVIMIACRRMSRGKRFLIRGEAAIAMVLAVVVCVNMICFGPMSTLIGLATGNGTLSDETNEEAAEAAEEAPAEEEVPAEAAPVASVQGAVTTIKHGKVVISIKEGKDIYLELPI